jgi:hypothetical protein
MIWLHVTLHVDADNAIETHSTWTREVENQDRCGKARTDPSESGGLPGAHA